MKTEKAKDCKDARVTNYQKCWFQMNTNFNQFQRLVSICRPPFNQFQLTSEISLASSKKSKIIHYQLKIVN